MYTIHYYSCVKFVLYSICNSYNINLLNLSEQFKFLSNKREFVVLLTTFEKCKLLINVQHKTSKAVTEYFPENVADSQGVRGYWTLNYTGIITTISF